jgi:Protein of unknown function (DUF3108)
LDYFGAQSFILLMISLTGQFAKHIAVSTALLSVLFVGSVLAQQPAGPKQLPFQIGEELTYKAELSKGILRNIDVAEFHFKVSQEPAPLDPPGKPAAAPAILLNGDVVSNGFFVRLFGLKFHEHIDSRVSASPFTVLQTNKIEEQNKRARSSQAVFDHDARKVTWTERDQNNPSQPTRVASAEFTEPIHDVVSSIYFLRTQHLEIGKPLEIELSDSGRVFHVQVNVIERKRIKTILGNVYALRIEPALFGEAGMIRGEGKFSIWVTDDDRHIPLRAQIKVPAGTFNITLKRATYSKAQ